jgi:hypothetical protein
MLVKVYLQLSDDRNALLKLIEERIHEVVELRHPGCHFRGLQGL